MDTNTTKPEKSQESAPPTSTEKAPEKNPKNPLKKKPERTPDNNPDVRYLRKHVYLDWLVALLCFIAGSLSIRHMTYLDKITSPPFTPREPEEEKVSVLSTDQVRPIIPHVLAPVHQGRVYSTQKENKKMSLRWKVLPLGLLPQIEFHRDDDPSFWLSEEPTLDGVAVDLPDGHYRWRVRTVNSISQRSEWSQEFEFSVKEGPRPPSHPAVGAHPAGAEAHASGHESEEHASAESQDDEEDEYTAPPAPHPKNLKKAGHPSLHTHALAEQDTIPKAPVDPKYLPVVRAAQERIDQYRKTSKHKSSQNTLKEPPRNLAPENDLRGMKSN